MLRAWKAALAKAGENAFPGQGNFPALEEEQRRLRAEVKRLTMEEELYSRRIIGWSMGLRIDSRLVVNSLEMAISRRLPIAGLVAPSDRGSQYASEHYRGLLARHAIVCGMSRRGNRWDNAPIESFFASLRKELIRGETYATREQALARVLKYIEVFLNRIRRHSSLGYKSPAEYEIAS